MPRHPSPALLVTLLLGVAVASAGEHEAVSGAFPAHEVRPWGGSAPEEPSEPPDVASLDPVAEHASVAPRPDPLRQLPATRAPGRDLVSWRGDFLVAHRRPLAGSGCAQVARWCLAHATSTSTP